MSTGAIRTRLPLSALLPLASLGVFLFYGFLMLPMLGFESDEIMFAYDLQHPRSALGWLTIFHRDMPYMLMSYLGALKSWLYLPLFSLVHPTVWTIRTPTLLAAALTILLAGLLLYRVQDWYAALIVVSLLATDMVFQITAVFDWGPVVLQNLLLVIGLLTFLKWYRERRDIFLFLAAFTMGLQLWDKALFLWNLSGMVVAALLLAAPTIIRLWSIKRAAILLFGLYLGASLLIRFNIKHHGSTLNENTHFASAEVPEKAQFLKRALNSEGSVLIVPNSTPAKASSPIESFALLFAGSSSEQRSTWRFGIGIVIIFAAVFAATGTQRNWIVFFFLSGVIGWFESALTQSAGGSIHHVILFWINWYCAFALSASCLMQFWSTISKPAILALIVLLTIRGAWSENYAYANLIRFTPIAAWSSADESLASQLLQSGVKRALMADWGIGDVVAVRTQDKIAVSAKDLELNAGRFDQKGFTDCVPPSCVVVTHTPDQINYPLAAATLDNSLSAAGLSKVNSTTVRDSHGNGVFSVFGLSHTAVAVNQSQDQGSIGVVVANNYPHSAEFKFWAKPIDKSQLVQAIYWSAPGVDSIQVRVNFPAGQRFAAGGSSGEATTGPWCPPGTKLYLEENHSDGAASSNRILAVLTIR